MNIPDLYKIFNENPIVTTDSRNCPKGSIFFALKGERFNGNHYAKETIEKGCAYAIVDEIEYANGRNIIYVENVLTTLQKLANFHRNQLNIPIVGITGTNGKTTTKELIASVLQRKYKTLYTQGNLNNHIGVPLTLLQLKNEHEIGIIEMGANHPGEIKTLVEIVNPNYGIITNVGKAHIEGFGSFEGVVKTKSELYDFLRNHNGTAFVNKANEILMKSSKGISNVIYYGKDSDFESFMLNNNPFLELKWRNFCIKSKLIGSYNAENIMAAIAIGCYFSVKDDEIVKAIEEYTPTNNRSQYKKTEKNDLIIDAYNANPTSMNASIDNFNQIENDNKIVILGDMKELGEISDSEHQKVVDKLEKLNLCKILIVGSEFGKTETKKALKFTDINDLNNYLVNENFKNHLILIKGSNSMKLIECINHL
jgi:UDP-N-acetylmuramoyl-tripeptide--D-alanyl-D-alanine ligase